MRWRQAQPCDEHPLEPPPYWTDRPFQSSGRLIWKLMLGALGSIGLMWPRTLQKDGVAGVMRAAGVGPRSATAKGTAATIAALSIAAVPLGRPIAEGGRSCLRSAAQASSVLLPNGMAWAGYPTTPTMSTTHVAIAHRDAAMPEVGLPSGAV
jgi:hypothetical protein